MKFIFFLSVILGVTACNGQLQNDSTIQVKSTINYTNECSRHYFFNDEIIDLELLKSIDLGGLVVDFKKCSKYAHRFKNTRNDTVRIGQNTYILELDNKKNNFQLICMFGKQVNKIVSLPVTKPLPEVHEYSGFLIPHGVNVIVVMEDLYDTKYIVGNYNYLGKGSTIEIEHTYITHPEPKTNHHHRYLYYSSVTASQLIFTSHMAFADKFKTIVVNMDDLKTKEYDKMAHGIILDDDDDELIGFVTSKKDYKADKQPTHFEITMVDGKEFSFDIDYGDEACEFLMKDSLLYIGNYHPISTGSSLHCFDMRTGNMKWKADVLQVNASHSEYWNKVTLSMYKDKIIMQGDEAYGSYLQIFDAESGERLAHFGNVMKD